jgi:2-beta-glucuronyltransferase
VLPIALLFTQQLVGLGTRKTGMVFWAETLARRGWATYSVTVQLSLLSRLAGVERLASVPSSDINRWRQRDKNLHGFVWLAPLHPAKFGNSLVDKIAGPALSWLYPRLFPGVISDLARRADLIVIESCAAVALFPFLKSIAPGAKFVYCASDRLKPVGMQPALATILERTALDYDLVRVPACSMLNDFVPGTRVAYIPHGIDKAAFDRRPVSPYQSGRKNAVVAGDMMFDRPAIAALVDRFPDTRFHAFGRMDLGYLRGRQNLICHGEVPFDSLVPYLIHADIGLAPYAFRPNLDYVSESSLKLLQYTYCRLPVIAPEFAKGGRDHVITYSPDDPKSVIPAFERALAYDRSKIDRSMVVDWDEVIRRVLELIDLSNSPND